MQEVLKSRLHYFLKQNNPEILLQVEENQTVDEYLTVKVNAIADFFEELQEVNKPAYIIEELCMQELTKDLKPSKFNYICEILEEEFPTKYKQLHESGTLTYETVNIVAHCNEVFESLQFSETNEDDRQIRYAVIEAVSAYIELNK